MLHLTGVVILDIKLYLIDDDVIIGFIFKYPVLGDQSLEGGGGRYHWGLNPRTLICRQVFLSLSYRPVGYFNSSKYYNSIIYLITHVNKAVPSKW